MSLLLDDPLVDSSAVWEKPPADDTVAELLHRLGDIPAERVHLTPKPGTATEQDLLDFLARSNCLAELVDGTIVEKPVGTPEGRLASCLAYFTERFLDDHDLGATLGADSTLRIIPDQIRLPDFSFLRWESIPGGDLSAMQVPHICPDLAVEILSPSNTKREMERKRKEYFAGGSRIVWEVDPKTKTVSVYTSPDSFTTVNEAGTLTGGDVLPGFTLSVKVWFDRAFRKG